MNGNFYTGTRNKGGNAKTRLARLAAKLKRRVLARRKAKRK